MIDVITTSFYIKAPAFDRSDFEKHSRELFDEWERHVRARVTLPDYSLTLVIEEGSIKGFGKIAATTGALCIAIGNYGSFVSGIQTIRAQGSYVASALFEQAKESFGCGSTRGNSKKSGGEIFYLRNLFERVQRGDIDPDQAIREVHVRLGEQATSEPGFLTSLASGLADAPRHPKQMTLPYDSLDECIGTNLEHGEPKPRLPHIPPTPIVQHFRIEISRPSKGKKKKVTLTKIS